MANELDPLVGQWYLHLDKGQRFYITATDEVASTVEVQHFDGDIEEYSLSEWRELNIEPGEMPENWSGALDITEPDDFGTGITDTNKQDWDEPQEQFPTSEKDKPTLEAELPIDDYSKEDVEDTP